MIAAWHSNAASGRVPRQNILDALQAYGGRSHCIPLEDGALFAPAADSTDNRSHPPIITTVLHGWIDDPAGLAKRLELPATSHSALYSAALERWGTGAGTGAGVGIGADNHLSGNYAAISQMPDGSMRLARSAWDAPPLYFAQVEGWAVASPLLRVLFAAGVDKRLNYDAIIDQLAASSQFGNLDTAYFGISRVSLGHSVTLRANVPEIHRWYDPVAIKPIRFAREEEYTEQALELLDEAARQTLAQIGKPALALSGGLDSPLVATALVDAMPAGTQLDTISFRPDPDWPGTIIPGIMGDEAPLVKKFAAMHPRITPHFSDPAQAGFTFRSREMASAMQCFAPGLANIGMYHGVYAKAKELGCDWLLTADLANQSFSNSGRWAYVEYARGGKWGELVKLLRNRPGDSRPLWRKICALSLMPQLPVSVQNKLRGTVHPNRRDMLALLTPLTADARQTHRSNALLRERAAGLDDFAAPNSREEVAVSDHAAEDGEGADISLAFEQLYGVRHRDVTAYRPLIEYCLGLPTAQFASGGEERRLARRMAKGRMPEEQRLNMDYGQHNIDWITRFGRERETLIASCETMRDHPILSNILDIDRMKHLLTDWPESQTFDIDSEWPRMFAIPQAILVAQFIGIAEGRNDL